MKIACLGPAVPYRGGIAQFNRRLATQLALANECFLVNFSRLYPQILFPGKTQFAENDRPTDIPNHRVIDSLHPLTWLKTVDIILKSQADIVLFHWWHPFFAPAYRVISGRLGNSIKKIAVCHNLLPHEAGPGLRRAVKLGLGRMDGLILHSRDEHTSALHYFPKAQSALAFHPLYDQFPGEDIPKSQARQRLGLDEDSKIILYFGLIRPYKGVDVLIEALLKLKMDVNLKALIVGEIYKGCESIRERLKQLPADRVLLIDKFVPDNEVAVYFRAADLVVLPYKSATQSGVIPIAYRCRRPVVATRVGGLPEAVEDGLSGWLVPPNNADELARAICCYFSELNTPDMEAGIETIAKRLTWERYVEVLSDLAASIKPN